MKLEKICSAIKTMKDDDISFYDKKYDTILAFNLKKIRSCSSTIDLNSFLDCISDEKRFVRIPPILKASFVIDFIKERCNPEERELLSKATGYRSFRNRLEKLNLLEQYDYYFNDRINRIAYELAIDSGIIEEEISASDLKEILILSLETYSLKPWKHFADMDSFLIHYEGEDIYYTILGNAGDCYGVEIYYGTNGVDGLILEQTLSIKDQTSILPIVVRDSFNVYFDPYSDLGEEEKDIIDSLEGDIKDDYYPSPMVIETGFMPRYPKTKRDYIKYKKGLIALNLFIGQFNKKPRKISQTEYTHFEVHIWGEDVEFKKNNKCIPEMTLRNFLPDLHADEFIELRSKIRTYRGDIYAELKALPSNIVDEKGRKHAIFLPILYDKKSEKVLTATPVLQKEEGFVEAIIHSLAEFFEEAKIGNTIIAREPLIAMILEVILGEKIQLEFREEPFEEIEEFLEDVYSSLCDEFPFQETKNYIS